MNDRSTDLSRSLQGVMRRWKLVLAIMVVCAAAGWAYTTVAAERFEATARVSYQPPARDDNITGNILPSTGYNEQDMRTLAEQARTPQVMAAAASELGISEDQLRGTADVLVNGDTTILNFIGRAESGEEAAKYANAWANAFVADISARAAKAADEQIAIRNRTLKSLGRPTDRTAGTIATLQAELVELKSKKSALRQSLSVSAEAAAPNSPVWPKPVLTVGAALLIGLALGCGVALVLTTTDRRLRAGHADGLPAPVLVEVPEQPIAPKLLPLGPNAAEPLVADAFAALGARLLLDRHGPGAHVVLVTSARSAEGKSTAAANLASALARSGHRVVLVDADMRRPTQDMVFPALQGRPGLSQILGGGVQVEQALTLVAPNLAAIASGPTQTSSSVLLASVGLRGLVERLASISDVVVIDAPPVLPVPDALALAPVADQVLLCCRIGTSQLDEIDDATARLATASVTPIAIALAGVKRTDTYGYSRPPQGAPSAVSGGARRTPPPQGPGPGGGGSGVPGGVPIAHPPNQPGGTPPGPAPNGPHRGVA